jgi:peptidoglycan/LPS O-acetylase OafA/YrhL
LDHLDGLRIFAVLLIVPFHTGMIFVHWQWHVKKEATSLEFGGVQGTPYLFIDLVQPKG